MLRFSESSNTDDTTDIKSMNFIERAEDALSAADESQVLLDKSINNCT